jgi:hypothetical protein
MRLPSTKAKILFWLFTPLAGLGGYLGLDFLLSLAGIYEQGALKACGVNPDGTPYSKSISLLMNHQVPRQVDLIIFVFLAGISVWIWYLLVSRFSRNHQRVVPGV